MVIGMYGTYGIRRPTFRKVELLFSGKMGNVQEKKIQGATKRQRKEKQGVIRLFVVEGIVNGLFSRIYVVLL